MSQARDPDDSSCAIRYYTCVYRIPYTIRIGVGAQRADEGRGQQPAARRPQRPPQAPEGGAQACAGHQGALREEAGEGEKRLIIIINNLTLNAPKIGC